MDGNYLSVLEEVTLGRIIQNRGFELCPEMNESEGLIRMQREDGKPGLLLRKNLLLFN